MNLNSIIPLDFASKVRWRMKFQRNRIFITLSDKLRVREYASLYDVKCAPVLYQTNDPLTIPFESLPDKYMIKANHGWNWNILHADGLFYDFRGGEDIISSDGTILNQKLTEKYILSKEEVVDICFKWLNSRHKAGWAYEQISPMIFVEPFLQPADGKELKDYRFYTFNGKVKTISVGSAFYRGNSLDVFFDCNWRVKKLSVDNRVLPKIIPDKPKHFKSMISKAEALGNNINFVRVDFYDTQEELTLGEITLYPMAGKSSLTACPIFNQSLSDEWKLFLGDYFIAFLYSWLIPVKQKAKFLKRKWAN
ncbi:MAG: hypothetical protein ACJA2S_003447 [Cyclobacteriaceae bacterium]|jgi:hypothetical protein